LLEIARHDADDQRGFDSFAQHDQIGGEHWERLSVEKAGSRPAHHRRLHSGLSGNPAPLVKSMKHALRVQL
jgi:hypothetical protein